MHKLSIIIIGALLFSCNSNVTRSSGICLSFDDRSINEWFELRKLLNDNKVRVTFFVTQPDSLNSIEIDKLKILQSDGHEIGFHGNMHVLAENYIKENSYSAYLELEIDRGIRTMDSLGFNCLAFAYPYGAKYWFTDFLLLKRFKLLRGVAPLNDEKDISKIDQVFYSFDDTKTLSAIGFDNISGVTQSMVDAALERSIHNQEVLLLYAHTPSTHEQSRGYSFNLDMLKYIIQQANENDISFYTISGLKTKYNRRYE